MVLLLELFLAHRIVSESLKLDRMIYFLCAPMELLKVRILLAKNLAKIGAKEFLVKNREMGVEDLSQLLEQTVKEFTQGAAPIDDSTIIFVKRVA